MAKGNGHKETADLITTETGLVLTDAEKLQMKTALLGDGALDTMVKPKEDMANALKVLTELANDMTPSDMLRLNIPHRRFATMLAYHLEQCREHHATEALRSASDLTALLCSVGGNRSVGNRIDNVVKAIIGNDNKMNEINSNDSWTKKFRNWTQKF